MTAANTLPHFIAGFNFLGLVMLGMAYWHIRAQNKEKHRFFMVLALGFSALFLAVYVAYHFAAPIYVFKGTGLVKYFYYFLLITHVILAALISPLVLMTLWRALKKDFTRHKKIARFTFPLWIYVSLSGLVVYFMLYHLY